MSRRCSGEIVHHHANGGDDEESSELRDDVVRHHHVLIGGKACRLVTNGTASLSACLVFALKQNE